MPAVTAAELVCEYLFALVKIKDGPSENFGKKTLDSHYSIFFAPVEGSLRICRTMA